MRTVAHSGLLLLSGIFLCSAALSISTVRSWAEDENPSAHDEKLNPPRKLTGRDAANALVGNTIAGYDARDGIFVFFLAPDGSLEVPAAQATEGLPPKWGRAVVSRPHRGAKPLGVHGLRGRRYARDGSWR